MGAISICNIAEATKDCVLACFFLLSVPLFKDANAALGINIKSFFSLSSLRSMNQRLEADEG
jgi:hypothetical protein